MEKISGRVIAIAFAVLALGACSREEPESYQAQGSRPNMAENRYVIADYELLLADELPVELSLSSVNRNLKLLVVNHSRKSIFANENLLLQSMAGVPLVFLVVKNDNQRTLYTCGRFDDPPRAFKKIEVRPGETASFAISVAELKRRYCIDEGNVSVHLVDPLGDNFLSFARSNEMSI